MLDLVAPTADERARALIGDTLVPDADVVMDRGFTVPGSPSQVWPWLQQLGKGRGGWYLPRVVERLLPSRFRALRLIDSRWQQLAVGHVVPDYGPNNTFDVALVEPGRHLVYTSSHKNIVMSWAIVLTPTSDGTRVQLRLRLGGVRRPRLASAFGGPFDALTVAGMASGLRERLDAVISGPAVR